LQSNHIAWALDLGRTAGEDDVHLGVHKFSACLDFGSLGRLDLRQFKFLTVVTLSRMDAPTPQTAHAHLAPDAPHNRVDRAMASEECPKSGQIDGQECSMSLYECPEEKRARKYYLMLAQLSRAVKYPRTVLVPRRTPRRLVLPQEPGHLD
jgi:hypothetical protein